MIHFKHYGWPFYEAHHPAIARRLDTWARDTLAGIAPDGAPTPAAATQLCRKLVAALGEARWLDCHGPADAQAPPRMRTICLMREVLARHSDLADFCFAMQGLGTFAMARLGSDWQRRAFLVPAVEGRSVAAFALSEPQAGSDIGAVQLSARTGDDGFVLNGTKSWISNAGLADYYLVIARTAGSSGPLGLSCLIVPADTPGLLVEPVELLCPRPFGTLRFDGCKVPRANLLGAEGAGARIALDTLNFYRPTVGAAALGLARRAASEAIAWTQERRIGDRALASYQMAQHKLALIAGDLDSAALLVARAAWLFDGGAGPFEGEAALAKWQATEKAQHVIDLSIELLGARGVVASSGAGQAYREIRSLRIYEGTSDMQQLIVASQMLRQFRSARRAPTA